MSAINQVSSDTTSNAPPQDDEDVVLVKDLSTGEMVPLSQVLDNVDTFSTLRSQLNMDMTSPRHIRDAKARRFKVGDSVQCYSGKGGWMPGEVLEVNIQDAKTNMERKWPVHHIVPYKVKLSDSRIVYAPDDEDDVIKAFRGSQAIRFKVGDPVECHMGSAEWPAGKIVETNIQDVTLNARNGWHKDTLCPYKVQLDDGRLIFAQDDADDLIRPRTSIAPPVVAGAVMLEETDDAAVVHAGEEDTDSHELAIMDPEKEAERAIAEAEATVAAMDRLANGSPRSGDAEEEQVMVKDLSTGEMVPLAAVVSNVDTFSKLQSKKRRFAAADTVMVFMGARQPKPWLKANVLELNIQDAEVNTARGWPADFVAPYKIQVESGKVAYVPEDTAEFIIPICTTERAFRPGDLVEALTSSQTDTWVDAEVLRVNVCNLEVNKARKWRVGSVAPYALRLNDGKTIYALVDDSVRARKDSAPKPAAIQTRFQVGDKVKCQIKGAWMSGAVRSLNIQDAEINTQRGWAKDLVLPYKVQLCTGAEVYVFEDAEDLCVADAAIARRFQIGDKVECYIGKEQWALGEVVESDIHDENLNRRNKWPLETICPYRVLLDDGRAIYAPDDADDVIRKARQGPVIVVQEASSPKSVAAMVLRDASPEEDKPAADTDQDSGNASAVAETPVADVVKAEAEDSAQSSSSEGEEEEEERDREDEAYKSATAPGYDEPTASSSVVPAPPSSFGKSCE